MLSMLYSREAIEKAKRRGRAYLCLVCQRQTGEKRISEVGPMEDHIMETHVSRDRITFYCRLCMFKCQTAYQMNHHVNHYSRHMIAAKQMGITNHQEWIEVSSIPYKIGEMDMLKFSQEESVLFYLKKQSGDSLPAFSPAAQISTSMPAQPTGQLSLNSPQPQYLPATPIVAGQHTVPIFVPENQDTRMDQPTRCPTGVEEPLKSSSAVVNSTMADGFPQLTPFSAPNFAPVTSQWMEELTPTYWTPLPSAIHEPSTLTLSRTKGTSVATTQSHQSSIFTGSSLQSFRPFRASQEPWDSSILNTPPAPTV